MKCAGVRLGNVINWLRHVGSKKHRNGVAKHVIAKSVQFYIKWSQLPYYTFLLGTRSSHRINAKARHLESRLRGLTEEPTRQTGLPVLSYDASHRFKSHAQEAPSSGPLVTIACG